VAIFPIKNEGIKTAQRWCRGLKNLKYKETYLGLKKCYQKIVTFSKNPFICDLAIRHQVTKL
jgi:hypothetical protein